MKHMKVIALLAAAMMVQSVHAGPRIERTKQFAKVVFHCAKVVVGWNVGVVGWSKGIDQSEGEWLVGGSAILVIDGLLDLKNDLHGHIFHHLKEWHNRMKK